MKTYTVHLTRSVEYEVNVRAEDVDDAKEKAEALPLSRMKRKGDSMEAWDAHAKRED